MNQSELDLVNIVTQLTIGISIQVQQISLSASRFDNLRTPWISTNSTLFNIKFIHLSTTTSTFLIHSHHTWIPLFPYLLRFLITSIISKRFLSLLPLSFLISNLLKIFLDISSDRFEYLLLILIDHIFITLFSILSISFSLFIYFSCIFLRCTSSIAICSLFSYYLTNIIFFIWTFINLLQFLCWWLWWT